MKTLLLVTLGMILGSSAVSIAQRTTPPPHVGRITNAFYFRDATGRCLRLQPELAADGNLMVLEFPESSCR